MYIKRTPEEIFKLACKAVTIPLFEKTRIKVTVKEIAKAAGVSEKQAHLWKKRLQSEGVKLFLNFKPGRKRQELSRLCKEEQLLVYEAINHLLVKEQQSQRHQLSLESRLAILQERQRLKTQYGLSYERFASLIGIDPGILRRWSRRLKAEGKEGLKLKSRAPNRRPEKLSQELIERIVNYGQRWHLWHRGRIKITGFAAVFRWKHRYLLARHGKTNLSDKTIARYLREAGLYQEKQQRPEAKRGAFCYYFPGAQLLIDTTALTFLGIRVKLISVMDAASRAIFHQEAFLRENALAVIKSIKASFKRAGDLRIRVLSLLSDHGRSYKARLVWEYIKAEGSMRIFSAPYWPQGKAALERYFRTAKEALSSRGAVLFFLIMGILLWIKERILLICLNLILIGFNGKYQLTPNVGIDGKSPAQRLVQQQASPAYQEAATRLLEERERKSQLKAELITSLYKEFGLGLPPVRVKNYLGRYRKESITEAAQALRRKLVTAELPPLNRWYYLSKVTDIIEQKKKAAELLHAAQVIEDEKIAAIKREQRQKIDEEQRWYQTHPEQALEEAVEWQLVNSNNEFAWIHNRTEITGALKNLLMQHSQLTAKLKVEKLCQMIQNKDRLETEKVQESNQRLPEADKLTAAKEQIINLLQESYTEYKDEVPAVQGLRQLWGRQQNV